MTTYIVLFVIVICYVSIVHSENQPETHHHGHLWKKVQGKFIKKFNIDDRHFGKEDMLLFPDVAFQSLNDTNTWKLTVHGWRYQDNHRKDWLGFHASTWMERLARNIVNENDILYLNGSIDHDRLRPFFVTDRSNQSIIINIGDKTQTLDTDKYGEFYEHIQISNNDMQKLKQQTGNMINYEAIGPNGNNATGIIRLIEPSHGISIISDVDDTIKISEVLDKVRLLANTFISPFKPVSGMPDLFQKWDKKNPNCTFHYLSGMPDQLYTLTQEFITTNQFPDGSFHMRHFSWAALSLFDFLHSQSTFIHKIRYLRFFLSNTLRDYVLIGDSGEKDPEIYGTIAREYPERIRAIFIRAIKGESFDDQRFLNAFQGVAPEKWLIFNDPKQVPIDLSRAPRTIPK